MPPPSGFRRRRLLPAGQLDLAEQHCQKGCAEPRNVNGLHCWASSTRDA